MPKKNTEPLFQEIEVVLQLVCPRCNDGVCVEKPGVELLPLMRYECEVCHYPFNRLQES